MTIFQVEYWNGDHRRSFCGFKYFESRKEAEARQYDWETDMAKEDGAARVFELTLGMASSTVVRFLNVHATHSNAFWLASALSPLLAGRLGTPPHQEKGSEES